MTIHCVLVVFEGIFVRERNSLSLWERAGVRAIKQASGSISSTT